MTNEEATWLRDQICAQLAACPPEAIARLITSDPTENVVIQTRARLNSPAGPVAITLTLQHEANAPTSEHPAIPAEMYRGLENKGPVH